MKTRAPRPAPVGLVARLIAVAAAVVLSPAAASAQCAVCGNPAFAPEEDDADRWFDLAASPKKQAASTDGAGPNARVGLIYSVLRFSDIYTGTTQLSQADKGVFMFTPDWLLQIQLATLTADIGLPSGTSLSLVLPMALASADRPPDEGDGTAKDSLGNPLTTVHDRGLADIELRARQRLDVPLRALIAGPAQQLLPNIVLSVGAVAPTGAFIPKDPDGNLPNGYASLGRGVWWALADLEIGGGLRDRLGWLLAATSRTPLTSISNNGFLFQWGRELRLRAVLTASVFGDRLSAGVGCDWLHRDTGKERIFAESELEDFINGGGDFLSVTQAVRVRIHGGLRANIAVRIPLWRKVNGHQPVPGIGGTLGLVWVM